MLGFLYLHIEAEHRRLLSLGSLPVDFSIYWDCHFNWHGTVVTCFFVGIFPFKADVRVSGLKKGKYVQDWPVPVQDINDELVKCGICGGYLGLVAQVLAMYSFLLTFQSPSLLHFVNDMDAANHFFDPTKLDPGSAFLVAQNHLCVLYVHCCHLTISTHSIMTITFCVSPSIVLAVHLRLHLHFPFFMWMFTWNIWIFPLRIFPRPADICTSCTLWIKNRWAIPVHSRLSVCKLWYWTCKVSWFISFDAYLCLWNGSTLIGTLTKGEGERES